MNNSGTKPSTAPTPPMMPSTTRPVSHSAAPAASSQPPTRGWTVSAKRVSLVQSVTIVPSQETDT